MVAMEMGTVAAETGEAPILLFYAPSFGRLGERKADGRVQREKGPRLNERARGEGRVSKSPILLNVRTITTSCFGLVGEPSKKRRLYEGI